VTDTPHEWRDGEPPPLDALLPVVYQELRRLAEHHMRQQPVGHTLQPTGLVHEAYLRLASYPSGPWRTRAEFFRMAGQVMRTVLVDHARAQHAEKRGGNAVRVTLGSADSAADAPDGTDVLALDEALGRLATFDAQKCRVVELRYFTGLTIEETAEALDISPATVKREWTAARAWLKRELANA
jgi:RNA polymerase sigma-70 factor (ECF subfamily)